MKNPKALRVWRVHNSNLLFQQRPVRFWEILTTMKVLRTDKGECTFNEFTDLSTEGGIMRENSVAYNLQHNVVAKRNNKCIISEVKAMIHDQSLLMYFRIEACNNVVYLHNKRPH